MIAPASSPFQRIADALAAEPSRVFTALALARAGQCVSTIAVQCAQRLVRERQVQSRRTGSGGHVWWWAPQRQAGGVR